MFSAIAYGFAPVPPPARRPQDVPPPTPVNLPGYCPRVIDDHDGGDGATTSLIALLQTIIRPTEVDDRHFQALGVHVTPDVDLGVLVPDPAVVPDFAAWDKLSFAEACDSNQSTRVRLNNGNMSPGVQVYHERIRELSHPNEAAFMTVRRVNYGPGQPQARLGNSYEFFRLLETCASYWDDTSTPPESESKATKEHDPDGSCGDAAKPVGARYFRTGAGSAMPPDVRVNLVNAFVKLVAYDFGCNVNGSRVEPRLYLNLPTLPAPAPDEVPAVVPGSATTASSSPSEPSAPPAANPDAGSTTPPAIPGRSSYFGSACQFVFRMPTTREEARAGIADGPLAAVSARHTTSFSPRDSSDSSNGSSDKESVMDMAREIVAALLTAQHRAREGRAERRVGLGAWWTTRRRWGGGEGGPIGREVDSNSATSTTTSTSSTSTTIRLRASPAVASILATTAADPGDEAVEPGTTPSEGSDPPTVPPPGDTAALPASVFARRKSPQHHPVPSLSSRPQRSKARRTTLAIYDNYRMVRPPSSSWDKKVRYSAIGREPGADYDDVFVVSAVFHHISILRVRVPLRLLRVLEGEPDERRSDGGRSWGKLEVFRSRWFDFFLPDDRIAAMKLIWVMMAYLMRKGDDVDMKMDGT
ncbi:hypothetical protein MAPG_03573 [Magnaporthiopsis poae ATCC 64411]|uniref:Uncharacterized protein n=1 Tax=Magnaporthiopsis poae (strain ATCC 64411 / 73-15) TaxID=644358 RepID=A0A0C4DUD3_MAGP6|nr:hypothetical protein MAPG_03573 [Magnaporthiopsis poae ATCC 64411]